MTLWLFSPLMMTGMGFFYHALKTLILMSFVYLWIDSNMECSNIFTFGIII